MVEIYYSPKFSQMYKKLSDNVKDAAEKKEKIFRKNPFDPKLKLHKLTSKLQNYWAFSINYDYRIILSFISPIKIKFHTIGAHKIYKYEL